MQRRRHYGDHAGEHAAKAPETPANKDLSSRNLCQAAYKVSQEAVDRINKPGFVIALWRTHWEAQQSDAVSPYRLNAINRLTTLSPHHQILMRASPSGLWTSKADVKHFIPNIEPKC